MIEINGNTITMTKGNTLCVQLTLTNKGTGDPYVYQSGDEIEFEMREQPFDENDPVMVKSIDPEILQFKLNPEDTADLPCHVYEYRMTLNYGNGDRDTFITGALLSLEP